MNFSPVTSETTPTPQRVVTHWRRFSNGLWRVPKGDIDVAYCAETFPKIKVFTHAGRLFTNCGCNYSRYIEAEVNCYPLVLPGEYHGAEPSRYTYEGREAAYHEKVFKLGAKVVFVASDPTLAEWRNMIRVLYADGGCFASHCTYIEFLVNRFMPQSKIGMEVRWQEMDECAARQMPQTQEEMRRLLAQETGAINQPQQIDFAL